MKELKITQTITNRETKSVESYLSEIGKISLITTEEEVLLAQKIRQGDQAALDRLCKTNLRFVVSVAKKYQNQGLPLGDLINEGNLGMIKAAAKFDETKGFKFISYAVWWIRQSILEAIANQSRMVRLPMNQVGRITKINRAISHIEQRTERPPTAEELAEYLDIDIDSVTEAVHNAPRALSFDAPLAQTEDSFSLLDRIAESGPATDNLLASEHRQTEIRRVLAALPERERRIIELSFGFQGERDLAPAAISEIIGICPERVRQLRNQALVKLQKMPYILELLAS